MITLLESSQHREAFEELKAAAVSQLDAAYKSVADMLLYANTDDAIEDVAMNVLELKNAVRNLKY